MDRKDNYNDDEGQHDDIHAPKYQPEDERLQLNTPQIASPRIKVIRGIGYGLLVLLFFAMIIGYWEQHEAQEARMKAPEKKQDDVVITNEELPPVVQKMVESTPIPPVPPVPPIPYGNYEPSAGGNDAHTMLQEEQMEQIEQEEKAAAASDVMIATTSSINPMLSANNQRLQNAREIVGQMENVKNRALADMDGQATGGNSFSSDQNNQDRKISFAKGAGDNQKNYISHGLMNPVSPYEVKAGAKIQATLETGINSDLPGDVFAKVRENVYDTVTGNYLLIPQGATLTAEYDSVVSYGQERVQVCWNRLILPNGKSVNLECMSGGDLKGYTGIKDKVNNHYGKLLFGVVTSSILSVGASASQGTNLGDDATMDQMFAMNVGQNLNNVGQQITQKNLNIQPTIEIRPGFKIIVKVNKDIPLEPYKLD